MKKITLEFSRREEEELEVFASVVPVVIKERFKAGWILESCGDKIVIGICEVCWAPITDKPYRCDGEGVYICAKCAEKK